MEKKSKRGPLLYVSQTFLNTPVKNMQEVYTSRQEVQLPIEEPQLEEEGSKKKGFEVSLAKKDLPKMEKEKSVKQEQNIHIKEEKSAKQETWKHSTERNAELRRHLPALFPHSSHIKTNQPNPYEDSLCQETN